MEAIEVSSRMHQKNLVEEMKEFRKLRTAFMMEKCMGKNEIVMCPKPRRQNTRQCGDPMELRVGSELSDILMNKASPPYYSVSPPTRANNPVIQDARFHEQMVQQNPSFGVNSGRQSQRTRSIPTMG
ncbi:hypothetical protein ACHQM5_030411 [Ranunculus cassubicifolius]